LNREVSGIQDTGKERVRKPPSPTARTPKCTPRTCRTARTAPAGPSTAPARCTPRGVHGGVHGGYTTRLGSRLGPGTVQARVRTVSGQFPVRFQSVSRFRTDLSDSGQILADSGRFVRFLQFSGRFPAAVS